MKQTLPGRIKKFDSKPGEELGDNPVTLLTLEMETDPIDIGRLAQFLGHNLVVTLESAQKNFVIAGNGAQSRLEAQD